MIALSSFKPFDKCTAEIIGNQVKANMSWRGCFASVGYYNDSFCDWLPRNAMCLHHQEAPIIRLMAEYAAHNSRANWTAILNADIILDAAKFKAATTELFKQNGLCAMSRRLEFDPRNPTMPARVVDLGMDFFCATPDVWAHVAKGIPEGFRLGANQFDTWLLGFWNTHYPETFYDLTPSAFAFHPKHGDRQRTSDFKLPEDQFPFKQDKLHMPLKQIKV